MAELMKLLEANGAFKSDLIQDLLYSAPQSSIDPSLTGGTSSTLSSALSPLSLAADVNLNTPSLPETTANLNVFDNTTYTSPAGNLNGNGGSRSGTSMDNNNMTNINVETSIDAGRNMNTNANLNTGLMRQETDTTLSVLEPAGARPTTPDPNANVVADITRILSQVHLCPSESRKLLVDQVTDAVIEAHMSTTINTYANVAEADERIQREIREKPELYSLSLNSNNLWQRFMTSMLPEITKVIKFCTKLPGFPEVELEDRIRLIKQGCFEVMITRFCILVDHVKEEMFDPALTMKAPRHIVRDTPMGEFLDQFFTVANQFNPLGLTDGEIGLFTAVLVFCPDREGLINRATVNVIQQLLLQSLYLVLKQNHSDADQTLRTLINMIPVFRKINEGHLKFLKMIKMKSPTEFEKKFPALHKELFDTAC